MTNFKINPLAGIIIQRFVDYGYEAYLVGGCVRDIVIGREPKDWDITTNARPEEIISLSKDAGLTVIPTGIKHGTVTVGLPDYDMFEITTYRIDGEYADGRHPDKVKFTRSLREDLARRDFTFNAMAYDTVHNKIIDPFGGRLAIENKTVRCVGDANERFKEDALRMLRAIRFACQLDFNISADIYYALMQGKQRLSLVSSERIREELFKMLEANPRKAMEELYESYLIELVLPEIIPIYNFEQENPHHIHNLWDHTINAMSSAYIENRLDLIVTMMLHDLGKLNTKVYDRDGIAHYYGHSEMSVAIGRIILNRLKVSNNFKEKVLALIYEHDTNIITKKAVKKLLNKLGEENLRDLFKVQLADASAQSEKSFRKKKRVIEGNMKLLEEIIAEQECFKLSDMLINGDDLIELGYKPGKDIGNMLRYLFDNVIENPELNNREYLINEAQRMLNKQEEI